MAMRIFPSPRARKDILDHYTYIGLRDEAAAERFLTAIDRSFARIAEHPDIGSTRLWRNPALRGIRAWPVAGFDRHLIYYRRQGPDALRVLRILHGAALSEGVLRTPS
ncbi:MULTISPECIES: type II toxin-antitoxin system RelE/ParE family toxin [Azospirillum]|uniref:type II toxin-antitoxin system RelE/ParE family toxin n=1 Tax=Azospirillum brasilense TaxID=192 RepID=UPI0013B3A7D3|nr:type II toxin-antitoxin system RelE/ParE family toxin [Azospirillum brasilense]